MSKTALRATRGAGTAWVGWLVVLAACGPSLVTDGFHKRLPSTTTRAIVWGAPPAAVDTTMLWLQKHGVAVIEPGHLRSVLDENDVRWIHTLRDEAALLRAAERLRVDHVVFIEQSGGLRAPMLFLRGVTVSTGELEWTGSARFSGYVRRPAADAVARLACGALASAWGIERGFLSSPHHCHTQ